MTQQAARQMAERAAQDSMAWSLDDPRHEAVEALHNYADHGPNRRRLERAEEAAQLLSA